MDRGRCDIQVWGSLEMKTRGDTRPIYVSQKEPEKVFSGLEDAVGSERLAPIKAVCSGLGPATLSS